MSKRSCWGRARSGNVGYGSVLLRIAVLMAWIVAGELGEMVLYKWVVSGRARAGEMSFESWKALLLMHGTMMWDQSLPL